MILYLCIGILLIVFGVAVACLSMLYKWRRGVMGLVSTFFVPLPVMLGLMLIACTAVESEKEVEPVIGRTDMQEDTVQETEDIATVSTPHKSPYMKLLAASLVGFFFVFF